MNIKCLKRSVFTCGLIGSYVQGSSYVDGSYVGVDLVGVVGKRLYRHGFGASFPGQRNGAGGDGNSVFFCRSDGEHSSGNRPGNGSERYTSRLGSCAIGVVDDHRSGSSTCVDVTKIKIRYFYYTGGLQYDCFR